MEKSIPTKSTNFMLIYFSIYLGMTIILTHPHLGENRIKPIPPARPRRRSAPEDPAAWKTGPQGGAEMLDHVLEQKSGIWST